MMGIYLLICRTLSYFFTNDFIIKLKDYGFEFFLGFVIFSLVFFYEEIKYKFYLEKVIKANIEKIKYLDQKFSMLYNQGWPEFHRAIERIIRNSKVGQFGFNVPFVGISFTYLKSMYQNLHIPMRKIDYLRYSLRKSIQFSLGKLSKTELTLACMSISFLCLGIVDLCFYFFDYYNIVPLSSDKPFNATEKLIEKKLESESTISEEEVLETKKTTTAEKDTKENFNIYPFIFAGIGVLAATTVYLLCKA